MLYTNSNLVQNNFDLHFEYYTFITFLSHYPDLCDNIACL